ncbi:MAG: MBOAT family O-acyltransferase [Actinomycetota bacterium]
MLSTLQLWLVVAIATSLVYGAIPPGRVRLRRGILIGVSALLIYVYNPRALVLAVLITLGAIGVLRLCLRRPANGYLPWLVMAPLVANGALEALTDSDLADLLPFPVGSPSAPAFTVLATLGLSFYSLKLYASVKECVRTGRTAPGAMLATALFFPSFMIGPIDPASRFDDAAIGRGPDPRRYLIGLGRIGIGAVKAFLLAGWVTEDLPVALGLSPLSSLETQPMETPTRALLFTALSFLALYLDFSGFIDIAIGMGLLFNVRLSENFRFPLIAHSIQDFWRRWHLTLAAFVSTYVFKPLVRRTGRPALALFVAFTLVGLWHEVSLGYLIWGLGHGAALALTLAYRERMRGRELLPGRLRRIAGVPVTLFFVAFLSAVANADSPTRMVNYLEALVGR